MDIAHCAFAVRGRARCAEENVTGLRLYCNCPRVHIYIYIQALFYFLLRVFRILFPFFQRATMGARTPSTYIYIYIAKYISRPSIASVSDAVTPILEEWLLIYKYMTVDHVRATLLIWCYSILYIYVRIFTWQMCGDACHSRARLRNRERESGVSIYLSLSFFLYIYVYTRSLAWSIL